VSTLKVHDVAGAEVGSVELPDDLLVLNKGEQALHDTVVAYMAAQRAGTASTLTKGEVHGSGAKPWRQKGTGRARAGYKQSPLWRGGAVAFGPRPRSFRKKVNRKVARLAFRRALSERLAAGEVRVVDELTLSEGKTRMFASVLKSLGIDGPALFVLDKIDRNVSLASRNVHGVEVVRADSLNAYQVLRYAVIVVSKSGMDVLKGRLQDGGEADK